MSNTKNELLLNLYFTPENLGCLVLRKKNCAPYKITNLCDALRFAADMHQLNYAVECGAKNESSYLLGNATGYEWLLNCKVVKGVVGLELLMDNLRDKLKVLFNWQGSVYEFREGMNRFIRLLPKYNFAFW